LNNALAIRSDFNFQAKTVKKISRPSCESPVKTWSRYALETLDVPLLNRIIPIIGKPFGFFEMLACIGDRHGRQLSSRSSSFCDQHQDSDSIRPLYAADRARRDR
jgi:hypothetical protein